MNIFQLSETGCPVEAAQMHCDKHVIKQLLESVQILCSVYHIKASHLDIPYKLSHKNHPSCIWTRSSRGNFEWLIQHSKALCEEYTKRYGKIHKSQAILEWCKTQKVHLSFDINDLQPFSVAIGGDKECRKRIRNFNDLPVWQQYRLYYVFDKPFAKWDRLQNTPQWFLDIKQKYGIVLQ